MDFIGESKQFFFIFHSHPDKKNQGRLMHVDRRNRRRIQMSDFLMMSMYAVTHSL
jgi:hypothetical protein